MPKQHHLTKLFINYAHCKSMHMGLQSPLNFESSPAVLSVLRDCIVCKHYNASTVKHPRPASLPVSHLSVPFDYASTDYTGHLWLRGRSGENVNVYILIFICFNTKAVHIKAVESMTTAEFNLVFIRFANRYGITSAVYSDYANFSVQVGGKNEQLLTSSV